MSSSNGKAFKVESTRGIAPGMGKLPPQALELEEAVLGAAMLEKEGLEKMMLCLQKGDCFYKDAHKVIFNAIKSLYDDGVSVDLLTITAQLRKTGELETAGGPYYLTQLTDKVNSSAHMEHHMRYILEAYMKRLMIQLGNLILNAAYDDTKDIFDLINSAQKSLDFVREKLQLNPVRLGTDVVSSTLENIHKAINNKGVSGVSSGLQSIDKITGGWQPGNMITLAARTAMGKTAIALGLLRNAFLSGNSVAYFTLEMTAEELMNRLISMEIYHQCKEEVSTSQLTKGQLSKREQDMISRFSKVYQSSNLQIDDSSSLSIDEFRTKAIALKNKHNTSIIFVDYLQLMKNEKAFNREQEIASISRGIKQVAKEINIPIIALAQVNRTVEGKADKRPGLSDLRESGSIEMDSNIVIFIYRPFYYGITTDENGNSTEFSAELIFAKNRNGPLITLPIYYNSMVSAIKDSPTYEPPF